MSRQQGPRVDEKTTYTQTFPADRKKVTVEKRGNVRGDFVKIMEDANGRIDFVCIPIEGLESLIAALEQVRRVC